MQKLSVFLIISTLSASCQGETCVDNIRFLDLDPLDLHAQSMQFEPTRTMRPGLKKYVTWKRSSEALTQAVALSSPYAYAPDEPENYQSKRRFMQNLINLQKDVDHNSITYWDLKVRWCQLKLASKYVEGQQETDYKNGYRKWLTGPIKSK